MNYFRWLVFVKCRDFFENGNFIFALLTNLLISVPFFILYPPIAIFFAVTGGVIWAFILFLFLQREWNKNREEYKKFMSNSN